MIHLGLKQFVPSEVCLKCDGCCRYKEAESLWRPKCGKMDQENLGMLITAVKDLGADGYLKTRPSSCGHTCRCLNKDNTCSIYTKRPFECALYPFILSKTKDAIKVYVHLSCPFVQDHQPSKEFDDYVAYLKEFFNRSDARELLASNKGMFHDYSFYAMELLYLFDLP